MKKNPCILISEIVVVGLCFVAATGCNKPAEPKPSTLVSAEKNSFQEVTARLDSGGGLYVYLSTEQLLQNLAGKVGGWREFFLSMPDAAPEVRANIGRAFNVVTNLIKESGVEKVSGFGMSSIALEPGFYHTKGLLHHYPDQGAGFLWNMFGQKAHPLNGLEMLPTNTALAVFSDADLALVWSVMQEQISQSGFPQAEEWLSKLPGEFQKATGLKWERVLDSLGGEYGLVLTLDDSRMIPVPLPANDPLRIPEPGLMLVVKVKDDTIFSRLDEELTKNASQQVVRVDKPNLKMRTLSVPLPLPIQLRPTVASSGGYLFIASTDELIQEVLAVRNGQRPGLKSTDEFKRVSRLVPEQGNQFTFLSPRFGATLLQLQSQALRAAGKGKPAQQEWLQSLFQPGKAGFCYSVSANTGEGWLTVGNTSQSPANMLLVPAAAIPGMLAAIAIPNFVKAREVAQKNACINNLRLIDSAKHQWALEHNASANAVPSKDDLKPYLGRAASVFPVCPQGGHYTIGAVDQPPACSIPGHGLPFGN